MQKNLMKERLYKAVSKDFDELCVTDSTLNEGTNCLVNELIGVGKMIVVCCHTTTAIKFGMVHTQEW